MATLTIPILLGQSATGLTLEAQVVDGTNTPVGGRITTGFHEVGGGDYLWTGTVPDGQVGAVRFQLASDHSYLALAGLDGSEGVGTGGDPLAHNAGYYTDPGSLGYILGHIGGVVTFVGPVIGVGTFRFVAGMALQGERGTAAQWTLDSTVTDLTDATVTLHIGRVNQTPLATWPCTILSPGSGTQIVKLNDVTSAQTRSLIEGVGAGLKFGIWASWSDSDTDQIVLVTGNCDIVGTP